MAGLAGAGRDAGNAEIARGGAGYVGRARLGREVAGRADETGAAVEQVAGLTYAPDIQGERYVRPGDRVDAVLVGDPSLSLNFDTRYVTQAQREAFGGFDDPMAVAVEGTGPNGSSIIFEMPRVIGAPVFPQADDRLQRLSFQGQAARTDGPDPEPMLRVTLTNTVAGY